MIFSEVHKPFPGDLFLCSDDLEFLKNILTCAPPVLNNWLAGHGVEGGAYADCINNS